MILKTNGREALTQATFRLLRQGEMTRSDGIRRWDWNRSKPTSRATSSIRSTSRRDPSASRRYNHRPSSRGGQCTAESRQTGFDLVVRKINCRLRLVRRRQRTQQAVCTPPQRHIGSGPARQHIAARSDLRPAFQPTTTEPDRRPTR